MKREHLFQNQYGNCAQWASFWERVFMAVLNGDMSKGGWSKEKAVHHAAAVADAALKLRYPEFEGA